VGSRFWRKLDKIFADTAEKIESELKIVEKEEQEYDLTFVLNGFKNLHQAKDDFRQSLLIPILVEPTSDEEE
jgi:hypothetical protein